MQEKKRKEVPGAESTCLLPGHFTDVKNASTLCVQPLKKQHIIIDKVTIKDTFKVEVLAISCGNCTP